MWSIQEEVAENSPARFIEVFVDSLDAGKLGLIRSEPAHTGRLAYALQNMIILYLYGYLTGVQSSWKLEWECGRNVELFYSPNLLHQDHNMIADFQKDNRKVLKKVFLVFVRARRDIKLMDAETLCLDGRTIRAVNSQAKTAPADRRASLRRHQALRWSRILH